MHPPTFTITSVTGTTVVQTNAGGSLKPLADGSYVKASPGAHSNEDAKRPHLRLIK